MCFSMTEAGEGAGRRFFFNADKRLLLHTAVTGPLCTEAAHINQIKLYEAFLRRK